MNVGDSSESILMPLLGLILISVALFAVGLMLSRRGVLKSRALVIGWAILTMLPLFGAGFAFFGEHQVERTTGETRSGVNSPPPNR